MYRRRRRRRRPRCRQHFRAFLKHRIKKPKPGRKTKENSRTVCVSRPITTQAPFGAVHFRLRGSCQRRKEMKADVSSLAFPRGCAHSLDAGAILSRQIVQAVGNWLSIARSLSFSFAAAGPGVQS